MASLAAALGVAAATVAIAVTWCVATLPPMRLAPTGERPAVALLDADGQVFAHRGVPAYPPVDARSLPPHVTGAFIAIEDRRFYQHQGIDPRGMVRAAFVNLKTGRAAQGASTITQQLVKNTMLGPERTLTRKLREAVAAVWVDHRLGKDEVLSRYLSTAYFGEGAYGLAAASQVYFAKSPQELLVGEAAMLAGLVKAPSRLAPSRNLEAARTRSALVIAAMVQTGRLGWAEAQGLAPATPIRRASADTASYFADWAYSQVAPGLEPAYGRTRVATTLDPDLQTAAETIISRRLAQPQARGVGQAALVAMRRDGSVVAMVGGRDHDASSFNRATQARRQPGSTFKLFTYLAAFRAGARPDTLVEDTPLKIGAWTPANADGRYLGPLTLQEAFARSSNVAAARVLQTVGAQAVVETARDLGVTSPLRPVPSLALGTMEVSLLELTGAYGAFAAGVYPLRPTALEGAALPGEHDLDWNQERGPMLQLLSASAAAGPAGALPISTYAKSGTSQQARDALFVGFAGDLVVGVWAGNDNGRPMPNQAGGKLPALIWTDLMRVALADEIAAAEQAMRAVPPAWDPPEPPPRNWFGRMRDMFGV